MENNPVKNLLVSKKEIALKLASEFEGLFGIESETYAPVLPLPSSEITLKDKIVVELGTSYIAFAGELKDKPLLARKTLLDRCRATDSGIRGTLSRMRKAGLVESSEKGEEITVEGLLEMKAILRRIKSELDREEEPF